MLTTAKRPGVGSGYGVGIAATRMGPDPDVRRCFPCRAAAKNFEQISTITTKMMAASYVG